MFLLSYLIRVEKWRMGVLKQCCQAKIQYHSTSPRQYNGANRGQERHQRGEDAWHYDILRRQ